VSADGTVVLESGFATGDAFIVLRANSGGNPGQPVGVAQFPSPGEFLTPITVSLDDGVWSELRGSRVVWAVLHEDTNGNGEYDHGTDEQLYNFGSLAGDRLTVEKGEAPASVVVQGQGALRSTDGTVTVRQVTLPADGRLVVRTDEDDSPGEVVGSTALDAGMHEDVSVPLDPAFFDGQDDRFSLHAQVQVDGEPVTAGGSPVDSKFFVTKPPGATAAPDGSPAGEGTDRTPTDDGPALNTPETTPTDDGPAINTPGTTGTAGATDTTDATGTDETSPGTATDAPGSPATDATDADGHGFGVTVAVVAAVVGLAVARRRVG
jgi:PGF-CTERM protein